MLIDDRKLSTAFGKDGRQRLYRFDNNFGASVVRHDMSYGGTSGLWELAVIKWDGPEWDLTYDTEITDDVLGWLSEDDVDELLDRIESL